MKQRLQYFDILKGMAIFLVVMGHVLMMGVRQIEVSPFLKVLGTVHMPLFFFISGYMARRSAGVPHLGRRALRLLVPMLAASSLWIVLFPYTGLESGFEGGFPALWTSEYKWGYWFTLVLFEITVLYALSLPSFRTVHNPWWALGYIAFASVLLYQGAAFVPAKMAEVLSLNLVITYFPAFMFGAWCRQFDGLFQRAVGNPHVYTACLLVLIGCLRVACWSWEFEPTTVMAAQWLLHPCLAIVAVALIRPWSTAVYSLKPDGNRATRVWCLLGRKSLAIYLLHYYFLFPMGCCRQALLSTSLGIVPLAVFSAVVACAVIAAALLLDCIIERSSLLKFLFSGQYNKTTA